MIYDASLSDNRVLPLPPVNYSEPRLNSQSFSQELVTALQNHQAKVKSLIYFMKGKEMHLQKYKVMDVSIRKSGSDKGRWRMI